MFSDVSPSCHSVRELGSECPGVQGGKPVMDWSAQRPFRDESECFAVFFPTWEEGMDWGAEVSWDGESARLTGWSRDSLRPNRWEVKFRKQVGAVY